MHKRADQYEYQRKGEFYRVWDTGSKVFCHGKCLTGSENEKLAASFLLITLPLILYYIFIAPYFVEELNNYAPVTIVPIIHVLVYLLMFTTISIDPGIIPKINPGYDLSEEVSNIPQKYAKVDLRMFQDSKTLQIRSHAFKLKWCQTCFIYRPPRASHCPCCDNCVIRFDHHCPWLGCCVGRRNYKFFYMFVMLLSILIIVTVATCIQLMVVETERYKKEFKLGQAEAFEKTLKAHPISIILSIFNFCFAFFVVGLWFFHTYLVVFNQTTNEYIKKQWSIDSSNPFQRKNIFKNCKNVLTLIRFTTFIILRQTVYINNRDKQAELVAAAYKTPTQRDLNNIQVEVEDSEKLNKHQELTGELVALERKHEIYI